VPRALTDGAAARLDPDRWPVPAVMRYLAALGGLDPAEMRAIFNGGIGMVAVVPAEGVEAARAAAAGRGVQAWVIGEVVEAERLGGRYAEGALGS
jgi:phosphoribosylformylglycinamidine cyclo-ligase